LNVLIVTGIWPPDVGGPASHAPEVADELLRRGHRVDVVTTADAPPEPRAYPVHVVARSRPAGARHARVATLVARRARDADVVYAASMVTRSALATAATRTPLVLKLSGDVAFERARRRGLYAGTLDDFEDAGAPTVAALRTARTLAVRRARHVVTPSEYLRSLALRWGLEPDRVSVVPNPLPPTVETVEKAATFAFAGRLTAAKSLGTALEAVAQLQDATFAILGDGEERAALERRAAELGLGERVRFLGAQPRERVLAVFRGAEAVVLSSEWENFPHILVEALAEGTPVVATRVGGVGEIVEDGRNGLTVEPGNPNALAEALRRLLADDELRARMRAAAPGSVERFAPERVFGRLEEILVAAAART
jgi:glycosyltransferase involved in cell wall biosynthesis